MDAKTWNESIEKLPGAHLLQTWEWGELKSRYGWSVIPQLWHAEDGQVNAAALVLKRVIPIRGLAAQLSVFYVPRGPLCDWQNETLRSRVLDDLQSLARREGAIFLKMDPEVIVGIGIPGTEAEKDNPVGKRVLDEIRKRNWRFSDEQIQFANSVFLSLEGDENSWLARMKQKTRYNVRLAQRKGVTVRVGNETDFSLLYRMYAETALRDGFIIRPEDYYESVWKSFTQAGMAVPLIAEVEGEPVAGLFLFYFAKKAWYLYGMSRETQREKMPTYLLQFEAMRIAKDKGCEVYDLWGAPTVFNDSDSMWGVYRFKEGLGGEVIRTIGAWDYPVHRGLYVLYTRILPKMLAVMRSRRKKGIQQEVN